MMGRLLAPTLATVLLCLQLVAASSSGQLLSLFPEGLDGFSAVEDGLTFCVADNLTSIYDGGYMIYVDRGVVMAASQFYTKDSSYYTIALHWMNSRENSSGILAYFRDLLGPGAPNMRNLDLGDGGFEYSDDYMRYMYLIQGRVFATIAGEKDTTDRAARLSAESIVQKAIREPILAVLLAFLLLAPCHRWAKVGS